ncbi:MAG TPA: hypothetical protein VMO26_30615 [Vicinamibacterales bacterium]|nr:hypothetical protein [Vicinamibacterales bacterium]
MEGTNAFGASVASNEIVITVPASGSIALGFNGLVGTPHGSPVTSYTESSFTITPTEENWSVSTT